MRKTINIHKLFIVKEALDKIAEQIVVLKQIEDDILTDNGFFNKQQYQSNLYRYQGIIGEEVFCNEDKEYIAKMNIKLKESI